MMSRMTIRLQRSPSISRVRLIGQPERGSLRIAEYCAPNTALFHLHSATSFTYIECTCRMQLVCGLKRLPGERAMMNREKIEAIALGCLALAVAVSLADQGHAQGAQAEYSKMAPIDQYLMADRNAEIAFARTAAPESISRDAEVVVLGRHGYETAVKGTNGFVCIVERSWMAPFDDPEFLNPDQRLPLCLNPPGARTHLALTYKMTELAMAGLSKTQMFESIKAAYEKKQLPMPEPGSMCYMMS